MSNYQTARTALGARLKEMRAEAGLSGKQVAAALGWLPSKVSKLEHGKQTPTEEDLRAWAATVGQPAAANELTNRLRALETHYASWKRQMSAGIRARQEAWGFDEASSTRLLCFESACVPGLLQTPEYARHMFLRLNEVFHNPGTIDDGVRARMRRQQILYDPGRTFHFLIWEAALHVPLCPPEVMAGQLDRLVGAVGLNAIRVGIVPLGGPISIAPSHGFWVYDERLVKVETIAAELRITEQSEVGIYLDVWRRLEQAAVHGPAAHRLLARVRACLEQGNDEQTNA